jgi:hypothetical protein
MVLNRYVNLFNPTRRSKMSKFTKIAAILFSIAILFGCASSKSSTPTATGAEPKATETPSGTIHWEGQEFMAIIDVGWGHGTLDFKGQVFKHKTTAVGVGGWGGQKISATGKVYNLKDIADFPGSYVEVRGGAAVGKGAGYWYVRNSKGVEMVIKPHAEGLALSLGVSGISVKLVDE